MQSYQLINEGVPQDYVTSHVPRLRPMCPQQTSALSHCALYFEAQADQWNILGDSVSVQKKPMEIDTLLPGNEQADTQC